MMKRITLVFAAAAAAFAAQAQAPYTPPFADKFASGTGTFTTYDANGDGNTFKSNSYGGHDYSACIYYTGKSDSAADEWIFSPALSLKAGLAYEMTYWYKTAASNAVNKVEWKAGLTDTVEGMTVAVGKPRDYPCLNYGSWQTETIRISVEEDGDYYLGMHLYSDAGQGNFFIDDLNIAAGVDAASPLPPVAAKPEFAASAGGDALTASFKITAPSKTAGDAEITCEKVTLCVRRADREETEKFDTAPGAEYMYIDNNALPGATTYSVWCETGELKSEAAEVSSAPNIAVPAPVGNIRVIQDGRKFTLSWEAVTEPAGSSGIFLPGMVRYTVKCGGKTIAGNLEEPACEFTYEQAEGSEGKQETVSFQVTADLAGKSSTPVKTPVYIVGDAYKGEFRESFPLPSGKYIPDYANPGWYAEDGVTNKWQPSTGNSYPSIPPQDGDGGCLKFAYDAGKELRLYSPLLDFSELKNPMLKFWVYLNPSGSGETKVQPGFMVGGEEHLLGEPINVKSGEKAGWTEFIYALPAGAADAATQIVFAGYGTGTYNSAFIDNISVSAYLDHNLAAEADVPAGHLAVGEKRVFTVKVSNKGISAESDYSVELYADGEFIVSETGNEVTAGDSVSVGLPFTAWPKYAGNDVTFAVKVVMDGDGDISDNEVSVTIPVDINGLAVPTGVKADVSEAGTVISWTAPVLSTEPVTASVTESFETWEEGTTEAKDGWVFVDADEKAQKGLGNVNTGEKFAAMVKAGFKGNSWEKDFTANDGEKALAMTCGSSYGAEIDNWVISPLMNGGEVTYFSAFFTTSTTTPEQYDVMWSDGSAETADFKLLETKTCRSQNWEEAAFSLPENARRFAIRIHGKHYLDALCFDSFSFEGLTEPAVLTGYNVYLNDEHIATVGAEQTSYLHNPNVRETADDAAVDAFNVTALYDKGESLYSEPATSTPTTVEEVGYEDSSDAEYYTLQGVRITAPRPGEIVIVRRSGRAFKAIVR